MNGKYAIFTLALAASVISLGAPPVLAQAQRPGGGGGGMMQQNSVEFLISQGEALGLSSEQAEALSKIAADLSVEMEPIREEMMAARGSGREAMMAIRQQITEADEKAVGLAMEVLVADQRDAAKKLLADRPRRGPPGGG